MTGDTPLALTQIYFVTGDLEYTRLEFELHAPDCVAALDDESDYQHLADAGTCTCGAEERNQRLVNSGEPR